MRMRCLIIFLALTLTVGGQRLRSPSEDIAEYCENHVDSLRALIDQGDVETAVSVSHSFSRHDEHEACHQDRPFIGEATFISKVSTSHHILANQDATEDQVGNLIGRNQLLTTHVFLPDDDADLDSGEKRAVKWMPVIQSLNLSRPLKGRAPVVGIVLDDQFIISESPMRCTPLKNNQEGDEGFVSCDAGHIRGAEFENQGEADRRLMDMVREEVVEQRRLSQSLIPITADPDLIDATTAYATGAKRILAILTCPSDSPNCGTQSYPYGYCYGRMSSDHGCAADGSGARAYATRVMQGAHSFYNGNSWGALSFQTTVTLPIKLPYSGGSCGSVEGLDYFSGGSSKALDVMAYAAARAQGYDINNYDLNVVFSPRCPSIAWSGVGWVGAPGSLLYIYGFDHDASAAHELGHNFGANHASIMTGGSRGARAWVDSSNSWSEYGNPLTVMGAGSAEARNDFVIQGKIIFDWLPVSQVNTLSPFSSNGASNCLPSCGPYFLQPTDKAKSGNTKLALQISTSVSNRFYFVEHRTKATGRSAAMVTWSDVSNSGGTGIYSNSVLADCTPSTSSFGDAGCIPGSSLILDVGTSSNSRKIVLVVTAVDSSGALRVEISNNLGFSGTSPTPTPPTVTPPTATPPTPNPPTTVIETSVKNCDELGWPNRYGSSEVCGTSNGAGLGRCSGAVNWANADAFCKYAGGRLCTLDELQSNEARGTGCSYDSKLLWTSSSCASGHALAMGSSTFGSRTRCSDDRIRNYARCCADASATSSKSCATLGWANNYGSQSVCGSSLGPGLGRCSGALTYSNANAFCRNAGGRLCTVNELQRNEARGTGCSYDSKLLWTSSSCASGHTLAMGSSTFGSRTSCSTDISVHFTRCCADSVTSEGNVETEFSMDYSFDHSFSYPANSFSYSYSYLDLEISSYSYSC